MRPIGNLREKTDKKEVYDVQKSIKNEKSAIKERKKKTNIRISMDGKGRALNNVYIERFFRTIKLA